MQDTKERWKALCEQAAKEPDPVQLMKLVQEIIQLLDRRETGSEKKATEAA